MHCFKLFRMRKNGTLGTLFINRRLVVPLNTWLPAESHPTKGYAYRPGWHAMATPNAPHLTERGRVWAQVEVKDFEVFHRPAAQGGKWFLAKSMRVVKLLSQRSRFRGR